MNEQNAHSADGGGSVEQWESHRILRKLLRRIHQTVSLFFEGPPTANGARASIILKRAFRMLFRAKTMRVFACVARVVGTRTGFRGD